MPTFRDKFASFVVPEGWTTKTTAEGCYSLTRKSDCLSIHVINQMSYQMFLRDLERKHQRFPMDPQSGWTCEHNEMRNAHFGRNNCRYLEVWFRYEKHMSYQVEVAVETPRGWCWVLYSGDRKPSTEELGLLLSTLELGEPVPEVRVTASDRRKWKQVLYQAIQSVMSDAPSTDIEEAETDVRKKRKARKPRQKQAAQTKKVASAIVFADHYQFQLYDTSCDPFLPFPRIGEAESKQGFTRTPSSIWYYTQAHSNSHRVDIFVADAYVDDEKAERVLAHNLTLKNGECAILDHEDETRIQLSPGAYTVYLRAYNLGKEDFEADESSILSRDDLERYEMVVVPGAVDSEGVIRF